MKKAHSFPLAIMFALILILAEAAVGVYPVKAQSQPTPSDNQVNAIASQLYCPVCQNVTLDTCTTAACADWRELIRQKLAEGFSPDQIKAYFAQQYGERVLAVPSASGLNWLLYILPPLILLGGIGLAAGFVYRHRPNGGDASSMSSRKGKSSGAQHG